ncbi:hypothetical protein DL96DRAFT_1706241 [Flagelloscypha sp. PMI_526]|nr:hypothetical protein DL96DRAFT_1706241 [Flagelloscypha sp. PMI_526]
MDHLRATQIAFLRTIGIVEPLCITQTSVFSNTFPTLKANFQPTSSHERAVVTGLFTDTYAYSAAVLGHSLKRVNVDARMIAMYIPGHVSEESLCLVRPGILCPLSATHYVLGQVARVGTSALSSESHPPHNGHNIDPKFVDQYTKLQAMVFRQAGAFDPSFSSTADVVPFPTESKAHLSMEVACFLKTDSRMRDDMVIKMETAPFNLAWAEQNFLNLYWGGHILILPWIFNANIWIKYQSLHLWEGMMDELVALHMTSAKPFPYYDGGGVLTLEEMKVAIEWKIESHRKSDYDFNQELRLWLEEWERMVGDSVSQLMRCVPTSVGSAREVLLATGVPLPK